MPDDLDALMQRHASGDRSPEVLLALNRLAEEAFPPEGNTEPIARPPSLSLDAIALSCVMAEAFGDLCMRGWAPRLTRGDADMAAMPEVSMTLFNTSDQAALRLRVDQLLILPPEEAAHVELELEAWKREYHGTGCRARLQAVDLKVHLQMEATIQLFTFEPPEPPPATVWEGAPPEHLSDAMLRFHFAAQELRDRVLRRIAGRPLDP